MYHVIDDLDEPIAAADGSPERFRTIGEADRVAVSLTRKTRRLHRAIPEIIDLRDPAPIGFGRTFKER